MCCHSLSVEAAPGLHTSWWALCVYRPGQTFDHKSYQPLLHITCDLENNQSTALILYYSVLVLRTWVQPLMQQSIEWNRHWTLFIRMWRQSISFKQQFWISILSLFTTTAFFFSLVETYTGSCCCLAWTVTWPVSMRQHSS